MNPVTDERVRTCIRCKNRFVEPPDTVTRVCDSCRSRDAGAYTGPTGSDRDRR